MMLDDESLFNSSLFSLVLFKVFSLSFESFSFKSAEVIGVSSCVSRMTSVELLSFADAAPITKNNNMIKKNINVDFFGMVVYF